MLPGPGTPFTNIQMPVFGSHKSMQVVRAGIHPSAGQNHGAAIPINIPAAWDLLSASGSCLASLQSSEFSLLAELHPPSSSSRCPQECCKHYRALDPAGKPQPERSHISLCLQLSAKLLSYRNLLLANPLHSQSLHVCKILQKESSRAQSSIKNFWFCYSLVARSSPEVLRVSFQAGLFLSSNLCSDFDCSEDFVSLG